MQQRSQKAKSKALIANTILKDWHASLGSLLLKAEKAPDSLERLLAICRSLLAFLTTILKPSTRFQDTPCVILGNHYLSHRELNDLHRGDATRVYLQEICAYDPIEAPTNPSKYSAKGHTDIAKWNLTIDPVAHARMRREGLLLNSTSVPYLEIDLKSQGTVKFFRHDEEYIFTLPSLLVIAPESEECTLDFDGNIEISCVATGLRALLVFKSWKDGSVQGEVNRLAGDGQQEILQISGQWMSQINVWSSRESDTQGILFDMSDYAPILSRIPPKLNLYQPGPLLVCRLWSALLESMLYIDETEASTAGKKVSEFIAALPKVLKGSLMYITPQQQGSNSLTKSTLEGEEAKIVAMDNRPLPPASRIQHGQGKRLKYQLQYLVQSLSQEAMQL